MEIIKKSAFPENSIVIIDDEPDSLNNLKSVIGASGKMNLICIEDCTNLLPLLKEVHAEVLILDLSLPRGCGRKLLADIQDNFPNILVIVMAETTELNEALECMRQGAFDYIVKPVENNRLVNSLKRAIEFREMKRNYSSLKQHLIENTLTSPDAFSEIITRSTKIHAIFLYAESISSSREPILITGETGAGKELLAKAIHTISMNEGRLVIVNSAGLDDFMFSDTLFGHRKGAFTGAVELRKGLISTAAGGTLILDEIGDLSPASQIKLLRLIETGEYFPLGSDTIKKSDARIIVTTNHDLKELVETGRFRKDLYYRLSVHTIELPPLRERREDIPLLFEHFLEDAVWKTGKKLPTYSPQIISLLSSYPFPGNIRELRSLVYDCVSRNHSDFLSVEMFNRVLGEKVSLPGDSIVFPENLPTLKETTDFLITEALLRARGNQTRAAELLGISKQALSKRLLRKKAEF